MGLLNSLFALLFCFSISQSANTISMIESLIEFHGDNYSKIVAFLCNNAEQRDFLKYFAKNNRHVTMRPLANPLLSRSVRVPPNHITFVTDLGCPDVNRLLSYANRMRLFAAPFKWIAYSNQKQNSDELIEGHFRNISPLVDSNFVVAFRTNSDIYTVKSIFRRRSNAALLVEDLGNWTESSGFLMGISEKNVARRRKDLKGITLRSPIVITEKDSINHLTDKRDIHVDSIAKVNYVLMLHLADMVNASLEFSVQDSWGYKLPNNDWSGLVGELFREEADISGTAMYMTSDRIPVIDFIAMTTPTGCRFIFRQPKLSYVANVYTLPFDKYVWISVVLLILIMALIFYIVVYWDLRKSNYALLEEPQDTGDIEGSWSEAVLITFGALCQQGASTLPSCVPGRIASFFSFLSLMFLFTSYSANIVALLQSSSDSIQTLSDILHSRLDVGVHDAVYNHFYFSNATEPVRKAIYEQKVAPPGQRPKFYPIEQGIRQLRAGLFAFHVEKGPAYKIIRDTFEEGEKCGLKEIKFIEVSDTWIAVQKGSSYKKIFQIGLRVLQESGIQARENHLIYPKKPECLTSASTFISVGMVDCYPPLVLLIGGTFLSVLLLIMEIYVSKRLRSHTRTMIRKAKKILKRKKWDSNVNLK